MENEQFFYPHTVCILLFTTSFVTKEEAKPKALCCVW